MKALHGDAIAIDRIRSETFGLAALADEFSLATPVPSCGEWTLADLVWHLYEVQHFWCFIIGNRPVGPEQYDRPTRPAGTDLAAHLRSVNTQLMTTLQGADAAEHAWSWSQDQTVGFTRRRQVHEALVHHTDAILACGLALPERPAKLWADGIDEMLTVMLSVDPSTNGIEIGDAVIELATSVTGDRWTYAFATVPGTSDAGPATADTLVATPGSPAAATITGRAHDLNLWLWGRVHASSLTIEGDAALVDRLRALITESSG